MIKNDFFGEPQECLEYLYSLCYTVEKRGDAAIKHLNAISK